MEKLFCNSCRQPTNHKVVHFYSQTYWPEDNPDMPVDYAKRTWEIIQCAGCDLASFRELLVTSEDWSPDRGPEPQETRYPEAGPDQLEVKSFFHVPEKIDRIYRESIESFNIRNYILCAVGLRAVIEGICKDAMRNCEDAKKNLEEKIEGLHKKGILTETHAKILHTLRFIGNEAVHELSTPPKDGLKEAIAIVEHTIENLYVLPQGKYRSPKKN